MISRLKTALIHDADDLLNYWQGIVLDFVNAW